MEEQAIQPDNIQDIAQDNMPPADQEQIAPNQDPINPYDVTEDENNLKELQQELDQSLSALDSNFAQYYAENMPDEIEDMFFNDRESFLLEVEKAKQDYINQKIEPLRQKQQQLTEQLDQKKTASDIWQAQISFTKQYPNADLDEILRYYNEELSPKQKQQLDNLGDLSKAYEKIYLTITGQIHSGDKNNSKNLPKQTNAQFGTSNGIDLDLSDTDLPINRR